MARAESLSFSGGWILTLAVDDKMHDLDASTAQFLVQTERRFTLKVMAGNGLVAFEITGAELHVPDLLLLKAFSEWWEAQSTPAEAAKQISTEILLAELKRRFDEEDASG